jgi:putative nucleotidyltransferase with HDIG domain
MRTLKSLLFELEYPLANKENLQSFKGMAGWKGKIIWMPPEKFLRLVHPLPDEFFNAISYENIKNRMIKGLPLDFLVLEIDMVRRKVISHEGRHRAKAAIELGIQQVPVFIYTGNRFKRVPTWSPEDHDVIDKAEFDPEWKKELQENNRPIIIVGVVNYLGAIESKVGGNHYQLPRGGKGKQWRYNSDTKRVYWYHDFDPEEEDRVKRYLEKYGYNVERQDNIEKWEPEAYMKAMDIAHGVTPDIHEGIHLDNITQQIKDLEDEWEELDSQGTGHGRQIVIQKQLVRLWKDKKRWDDLYAAVKNPSKRINEGKKLVMEGVKAKQVEAFLKDTIAGTEWENKVFAVGGYVRDEIMGKIPKDLDVVVDKHQGGIEFTEWLANKIGNYKEGSNPVTFPKFGTAKMVLDGANYNGIDLSGEDLEAVMPRAEQYHDTFTRKPTDVKYTDLKGDAQRRDLTINAIYKNISTGQVVDPVGGVQDIKNKVVRPPSNPDLIYADDALRMFRVIRFATRFGWELTPEVADGIKRNLHRLHNTSKERIRDELNKIITSDNPDRGIKMLKDTGLLPYIAKELQQMVGMIQNVHHKDDVFDHTMEVLRNTNPDLIQRLMALFHDIGKVTTRSETPTGVHFYGHENIGTEIVERVMRDLKYPTDLIDAVKVGVGNHMRLKSGGDTSVALSDKSLRKFKVEIGNQLENVLNLIHADNISHTDASSMPNQIDHVRKRLAALDVKVSKPNLPINGNDLMSLGLKPGPIFSQILSAVTDKWYENPNISREEAIQIAKQMANI